MRENLIIVRSGDSSLHPQWLGDPNRNWDIAVSYYGDFPQRYSGQYDFIHLHKGSKWQGIVNFLSENPSITKDYKYIWLPDDDILTTGENITKFFNLCELLKLTVAQPALTKYSYHSWEITIQDQNENAVARLTNFVEIMVPCFKSEHFEIFSKFFRESTSGWGYEWLWWRLAQENNVANFGIIDDTPVYHTRPVGLAGHGGSVISPSEEFELLMRKFDLQRTEPKILKRVVSRN
jgi:hypothetical protein